MDMDDINRTLDWRNHTVVGILMIFCVIFEIPTWKYRRLNCIGVAPKYPNVNISMTSSLFQAHSHRLHHNLRHGGGSSESGPGPRSSRTGNLGNRRLIADFANRIRSIHFWYKRIFTLHSSTNRQESGITVAEVVVIWKSRQRSAIRPPLNWCFKNYTAITGIPGQVTALLKDITLGSLPVKCFNIK